MAGKRRYSNAWKGPIKMSPTTPGLKRVIGGAGSFSVDCELLRDLSSRTVMTVCLGEVSGRLKMIRTKTTPP